MTEMREQSSRENYGDYPVKGRDFMKKGLQKLALALCAALVMTSFAACSAKEEANNSSQEIPPRYLPRQWKKSSST